MSYFAKPKFIVYDEWFDDNSEKTRLEVENKKIKTISNIHDFFYEQSIYKVGGSENIMQKEIKVNKNEIMSNNFLKKTSEKYSLVSNTKFKLLENLSKKMLKFTITKNLIYSLSIFGFIFIFGFLLFLISQSNKNDSKITYKSSPVAREFLFLK